ncbi:MULTISPECIES: hypothetical protein [unclassified Sphingopyxis]|uniref:hypothetical protein n=1 Tax=unclassified Sphingopyxis TaxID=2614943 RepID=UPI00285E7F2B|nr:MULTISPECIES: hypothetical protein [unclassified Sphingopyxis]MDR7061196.1 putative RNA methylase [Sphingopyxis sp. BE235]MDR7182073.1 putative RNA methylase [Sphingopyxis sp. BE249]
MNAQTTIVAPCPVIVGQPLYCSAHGLHWVATIEPNAAGQFLAIGGPAPMSPIRWDIVAVSSDAKRFTMDEYTATKRAADGERFPARSDVADLLALADSAAETRRAAYQQEQVETQAGRSAAESAIAQYKPAWAECAIIAELHEDASDSASDYHNHRTVRTVVLAWSSHRRDLFAEMRKAAATFPETAHLAEAPENAEHREKYSMGAGYYLKNGWRDSSGWCVKKSHGQYFAVAGLEFSDSAKGITPAKPAAATRDIPPSAAGGLFTIEEHTHTKKGFQMHIAIMGERVDRDTYDALLSAARPLGGWYSKPWGGTPGGFAFKDGAKARQFVAEQGGAAPGSNEGKARPVADSKPAPSTGPAKLRAHADSMQAKIDHCLRDRDTNTPRKARMAAEARNEGTQWERAQRIARTLAERLEAGDYPSALARVSTKAELFDLAAEAMDRGGGYYDAGRPLGRPYDHRDLAKNDKAAAAWALLDAPTDPARANEEELRRQLEAMRFAKIPGYFPTPSALVVEMIERAELPDGADVLEPSAGSGAIADALRDAGHNVHCIERHASLADILRLKGHEVEQGDFMELDTARQFAAVIMNPPFENGQDVEHVRRAFEMVRPGGALVAIMGAGVSFRAQRPYSTFREWLEEQGGEMAEIPAGAFKESGTGVASVMIVVRKGAE